MKSKLLVLIFATLFAVGFGTSGYHSMVRLYEQLHGYWAARDWVAVQATVIEATLNSQTDDTTAYQASTRYRYSLNGHDYEGRRIGWTAGFDNIGSWQRDQYEKLSHARNTATPIIVWVDSQHPEHAVVDRELRWNALIFAIPFATLFPLVSLGALWFAFNALRTRSLTEGAENAASIESNARTGLMLLWGFAAFWNLLSLPLAVLFFNEARAQSLGLVLLLLLFPMVGVALLALAIRQLLQFLRHGQVALQLAPRRVHTGESFKARIKLEKSTPIGAFTLTLRCQWVDARGEDTSYKTLWEHSQNQYCQGGLLNRELIFSCSVPAHLPASEDPDSVYDRWQIELQFPDSDDKRSFDVVVQANPNSQVAAIREQDLATQLLIEPQPVPPAVANIEASPGRVSIVYAKKHERELARNGIFIGTLVLLVAALIVRATEGIGVGLLIGVSLTALGIMLVGSSIYAATHRRSILVSNGILTLKNPWLFYRFHKAVKTSHIQQLQLQLMFALQRATQPRSQYRIVARTLDGQTWVLGSYIEDPSVALTLMQLLIPHLPSVEFDYAAFQRIANNRPLPADLMANGTQTIVNNIERSIQIVAVLFVLAFVWSAIQNFL